MITGVSKLASQGDSPPVRCLNLQEHRLSPIILRPHREVQPVATALIAFNEQLVIIMLSLIGIVHQDYRISQGLLIISSD